MQPAGNHHVEFHADSGTGKLTAGQRFIWQIIMALAPDDEHLNLNAVLAIPHGCSLDTVTNILRLMLETHASLRTTYTCGQDGEPVQTVRHRGVLDVVMVEAADSSPEEAAAAAAAAARARRFDLEHDLPLRASVVTHQGRPAYLTLVASHMVADGLGMSLLVDQVTRLLAGGDRRTVLPAEPWQPLDQVEYEASPEAIANERRTLAHMRESFMRFPATLFPRQQYIPQQERYWFGSLSSAAVAPAAGMLARRFSVTVPAVIIGAAAQVLHRLAAVPEFGFVMRTFNRYRPQAAATAIGHFSQDMPVLVKHPGQPLSDVCQEAQSEVSNMFRCSHYWPPRLQQTMAEVNAERGTELSIDAAFNHFYYSAPARPSGYIEKSADELFSLAASSSFQWVFKRREEKIKFLLLSGLDGLSLLADTAHLPPYLITQYLREVESTLVTEAARGPSTSG